MPRDLKKIKAALDRPGAGKNDKRRISKLRQQSRDRMQKGVSDRFGLLAWGVRASVMLLLAGGVALTILRNRAQKRELVEVQREMFAHVKADRVEPARKILQEYRWAGRVWDEQTGKNPLHIAAENGSVEFVRLLIEYHAPESRQDELGRTPLHYAAKDGNADVIELLLNATARVNLPDKNRQTPLHLAAAEGNPEAVRMLLDADAVHASDHEGDFPLHLAAGRGQAEAVRVLLEANAPTVVRNRQNQTPAQVAAEAGHDDVARIFAAYHAREDEE